MELGVLFMVYRFIPHILWLDESSLRWTTCSWRAVLGSPSSLWCQHYSWVNRLIARAWECSPWLWHMKWPRLNFTYRAGCHSSSLAMSFDGQVPRQVSMIQHENPVHQRIKCLHIKWEVFFINWRIWRANSMDLNQVSNLHWAVPQTISCKLDKDIWYLILG